MSRLSLATPKQIPNPERFSLFIFCAFSCLFVANQSSAIVFCHKKAQGDTKTEHSIRALLPLHFLRIFAPLRGQSFCGYCCLPLATHPATAGADRAFQKARGDTKTERSRTACLSLYIFRALSCLFVANLPSVGRRQDILFHGEQRAAKVDQQGVFHA